MILQHTLSSENIFFPRQTERIRCFSLSLVDFVSLLLINVFLCDAGGLLTDTIKCYFT